MEGQTETGDERSKAGDGREPIDACGALTDHHARLSEEPAAARRLRGSERRDPGPRRVGRVRAERASTPRCEGHAAPARIRARQRRGGTRSPRRARHNTPRARRHRLGIRPSRRPSGPHRSARGAARAARPSREGVDVRMGGPGRTPRPRANRSPALPGLGLPSSSSECTARVSSNQMYSSNRRGPVVRMRP
jgi:hypothetical protein